MHLFIVRLPQQTTVCFAVVLLENGTLFELSGWADVNWPGSQKPPRAAALWALLIIQNVNSRAGG